ncbi:hypothetical protein Cgig2_013826 [Carnegiea gigantea]|uniref:Transmembrane protein n=1 Tax=Carnegiea gigantea TaxID=171969 RepID=A0A9Q1JWP8_9CARY|nr:hypothetical protein Cgig2_013826 [Carnegiea gigantea]
MDATNSHLKNSIVDVNSASEHIVLQQVQKSSFKHQEFYKVIQLDTKRTNWFNWGKVDLVSFFILSHMCLLIHMSFKLYGFMNLDYNICVHLSTCLVYYMMVNIINNLTLPKNLVQEMAIVIPNQYIFPNTYLIYIYTKLKTNQNHFYQRAEETKDFRTVYVKIDYQDNINLHNCGIYIMHHMETYSSDLHSWDLGFQMKKVLIF